jgi:hypothetical protein
LKKQYPNSAKIRQKNQAFVHNAKSVAVRFQRHGSRKIRNATHSIQNDGVLKTASDIGNIPKIGIAQIAIWHWNEKNGGIGLTRLE